MKKEKEKEYQSSIDQMYSLIYDGLDPNIDEEPN